MPKISIAIAGTTQRTRLCAEALSQAEDFEITWIVTPEPKPLGRKKVITPNPLHSFATEQSIPTLLIKNKITSVTRQEITQQPQVDILLVVDFGYLVPSWLLALPQIAPLNIHPSELPKWRGSSPGQFALLYGEKKSAITLIEMNAQLDQGPIVAALPFNVDTAWTAEQYYQHSFELLAPELPNILKTYISNKKSQPQPVSSPTPTARKLTKDDAFVPWNVIALARKGVEPSFITLPPLLEAARTAHTSLPALLVAATKAFSPWPNLWTKVETKQGEKRMKIISAVVTPKTTTANESLTLETVQLEGKTPALFNQIKNTLLN